MTQREAIERLAKWLMKTSHSWHACQCIVDCPEYQWASEQYLQMLSEQAAALNETLEDLPFAVKKVHAIIEMLEDA